MFFHYNETFTGFYNCDTYPIMPYIFSAVYVLLDMIVRRISDFYKSPVPSCTITTIFCILLGTFMYYFEPFGDNYQGISFLPAEDALAFFLPIYAISSVYQMEFFLYTRTLHQFFIVFCIGIAVTSTLTSVTIYYVVHPEWDLYEALLAAWNYLPVQPVPIVHLFRGLPKNKNVGAILEAESIGTLVLIYCISCYMNAVYLGLIHRWYQHLFYFIRNVVCGFIMGYIFGKITTSLMSLLYNEAMKAVVFLLGIAYLEFFFCEDILGVSGNVAVIVTAANIVRERYKFSTAVDESISNFFYTLHIVIETVVLCFYVTESTTNAMRYFYPSSVYASLIMYFCITFIRTCVFVACALLFKKSKMDIDYDIRTAFVLGLSGLKGSFNMVLAFIMLVESATFEVGRHLVIEMLFYYCYTMLANATPMRLLLRLMGFTTESTIGKTNMTYCLNYIMDARLSTVKILKASKYLADANWSVVLTKTDITKSIITRDRMVETEETEANDIVQFLSNLASCPDCLKEIPYDLNGKEIEEICLEARGKILKAKRISIIRQYETGAISKNCLQVLTHNIDRTLETNGQYQKLDIGVRLKPDRNLLKLRTFLLNGMEKEPLYPPTNIWRRFCFYLTNHITYCYSLMAMIVIYLAYISYLFLHPIHRLVLCSHIICQIIFDIDASLKLYSVHVSFHRFVCLGFNFICCLFETGLIIGILAVEGERLIEMSITLRVVSFFKIFYLIELTQSVIPNLIELIDRKIDLKITFGFDIAAALEFCCTEIIETLSQIIDYKPIRDIYERDLEREREMLVIHLGQIQRQRPWIAITMKTKQIIRTTLNSMTETLNYMKNTGYVDNEEFKFLEKELNARNKTLRFTRLIRPSSPETIFNDIPWLNGLDNIVDYLYNKVEVLNFDANEFIVKEGKSLRGIHVVIAGVVKLYYKANEITVQFSKIEGRTPIVDYIDSIKFDVNYECDINTGSTFGELAFLTHRKSDCSVIADSQTQIYLLPNEVLQDAVIMWGNPIIGLEAKMWKCCSVNLAVSIMSSVPLYQTWTPQEIKFKIDRAFVPNLRCYKMFVITEEMDDVLLLEGLAIDVISGAKLIAPMLIPKNIQKIYVSKSSFVAAELSLDTKLMIIPVPDAKELDVMLEEEEQAEVVPYATSKCLLHNIEDLVKEKPRFHERSGTGLVRSRPSPLLVHRDKDIEVVKLGERGEQLSYTALDSGRSSVDEEEAKIYLNKKEYWELSKEDMD